jgi:tetratricopeptide (TPR) repeat protein
MWNPLAGAIGSVVGGLVDSAFGSKGGPKTGGNYNAAFTSTGQVVEENMFGGYTPSELDSQMQSAVKGLQSDYTNLVKSLGGNVKALTINLGGDQDPEGKAGNRVSAQIAIGNVGTGMNNGGDAERALWGSSLYSSVSKGVGNFEEAIKLETARMLVAAVKASDLPQEIANSLNAVDLNTASQAQLDALIARVKELAAVLELFKKWQNVFPNFISASNDAKIALVELSGGIENFSGMLSSYYDNFYSDAEKAGRTWVELTDALHEAGVTTIPRTRAEYRKLVESVNLNSESGRELYNTLLQLAPAFASVTESATIADNQLRDNLEKARQAVQDAYDRESGVIRTAIDRLGQFAEAIRKFRDSLYLDKELSPLSNYDKYQFARSKLEDIQQKALAGDEDALAQLEQASRDFLEYSRVYNANNAQYQIDFDSVQSFHRVRIFA